MKIAVASPLPVKLYQLHVPLPETEPDLIQSQIRFFFLYRKKSWNYVRKQGQFQLLFFMRFLAQTFCGCSRSPGCRKGQSYRSIIGYRSENITTKEYVKGLYFLQRACRAFSDFSGVRRFSTCNRNSRNFASRYRISASACFSVIQCISFL